MTGIDRFISGNACAEPVNHHAVRALRPPPRRRPPVPAPTTASAAPTADSHIGLVRTARLRRTPGGLVRSRTLPRRSATRNVACDGVQVGSSSGVRFDSRRRCFRPEETPICQTRDRWLSVSRTAACGGSLVRLGSCFSGSSQSAWRTPPRMPRRHPWPAFLYPNRRSALMNATSPPSSVDENCPKDETRDARPIVQSIKALARKGLKSRETLLEDLITGER